MISDYEDLLEMEGVSDFERCWFVAQHRPGAGEACEVHLGRQGFEFARPTVQGVALFPGYIFIRFGIGLDRWQVINSTIGINHLLPLKKELPLALPNGFVDEIIGKVRGGAFDRKSAEELAWSYVTGEALKITGGSFEGFIGEFRRRENGVLILLLSLLGAKREVKIPPKLVARPVETGLESFRAPVR